MTPMPTVVDGYLVDAILVPDSFVKLLSKFVGFLKLMLIFKFLKLRLGR